MSTAPEDSNFTQEPHTQDIRLVASLLNRDGVAWQSFVDRYTPLVRSRIAMVMGSKGVDNATLDDATAEVFASLLVNDAASLRAYQGRSSLMTYLAVISTRCALHSVHFRRRFVQAEIVEEPTTREATPLDDLVSREHRESLPKLLERLPRKQRAVLELFHLQGKSYAEISHQLDMPIGSVGVTLRRAEQKLRLILEEDVSPYGGANP